MASIVIPPGYAQVVLRWQQAGRPNEYLATHGVELASGISDPSFVADEVNNIWGAQWGAATMPTDYVWLGSTVYVGQDGNAPLSGEDLVNITGSSASARPTPNCALLVSKRSATGGRRNQGRMYLPAGFLLEADLGSDGRISASPLATFQTKMTNYITNLKAGSVIDELVIFHSSTPLTPTVITSLQVQSLIGTQRERMRR